jgi:membrane fusion protein, multidrug efflux system
MLRESAAMAEPLRKPLSPVHDEAPEAPRPVPLAPATGQHAQKDSIGKKDDSPLKRRNWRRWGLFALLPLVLLVGGYWYVTGGQIMSEDDAYVEAEKVGVSTDVSGIVKDVDVKENEHVTAGQVLYRLDPAQFQIALDNAKANLKQTALTIESMKQDYKRMLSDIAAQQSLVDFDQTNFNSDQMLLHSHTISQTVFNQAQATLGNDKNKLEALRQQAQVQLAKLGGDADIDVTQHPQYRVAQARVDEAQRQLNDTIVTAPFAGIVTDVPSIAPGKYLSASTTAFYLVDTDHVWIEADPKETELTYVRTGQPVTVTVDTYPDRQWHGTVESISPAAAQEFALLPAQNTSGNWVKVVQRVPMRVRVDTSDKSAPPLAAGMSVEIAVDTGHARGFPNPFSLF